MTKPWFIDTTPTGVLKAKVPYGQEFLPFQPTPAGETANIEELYDFDWAKFRRNQKAQKKWDFEKKKRQEKERTKIMSSKSKKVKYYLED